MIHSSYAWRETDSNVELTVPLKGCSPKSLDILLCRNHIKLSCSPFLLDLPLKHDIDVDSVESKAVLNNGTLHITLAKLSEGVIWGELLFEGTKEEINQRREAAFAERTARIQRQHEKRMEQRIEDERMALKMQMALEEDERQLIEVKKTTEKKEAEEALYKTLADLPPAAAARIRADQPDSDNDANSSDEATDTTSSTSDSVPISTVISTARPSALPTQHVSIPPPRATIRATFQHTARPFQTPARESTVSTEREFLLKNNPSLLNGGAGAGNGAPGSNDIGDVDASWIAKKGEEFHNAGDYSSAASAFSSSMKKDSTMVETLVHRAASYLQLGDAEHCLADLVSAEKGVEVSPGGNDASIRHKIELIRAIVSAQQQKEKADQRLKSGDTSGALLLYDEAISMAPAFIPAVANRSACHLAMSDFRASVTDCTAALDMLEKSDSDDPSLDESSSFQPRLEVEVRKKLKDAVLRRRVLALKQLGQSEGPNEGDAKETARAEEDTGVDRVVAELDSVD
mmetsp:Transcript_29250/g.85062  ORF Transcript_29250/g.85062 Transcript_29250/m.85062 type:complete len:516 (+) Transcript_29250:1902-3449(+)